MPLDRPADLVILGGRVATMDPARSWASALAVRDGRIVAVGTDAAVRDLVDPRTRVIQARGRRQPARSTVCPIPVRTWPTSR